jgi:hypothetical protein
VVYGASHRAGQLEETGPPRPCVYHLTLTTEYGVEGVGKSTHKPSRDHPGR